MKLTWRIVIRISLLMSVVLAVWVVLFHNAIVEEVNDEIDDSLELFSENLIKRVLHGEEMPAANNGTNNTYFLETVSEQYALSNPNVAYSNEDTYIKEKDDVEPARLLRTVFRDNLGESHMLTVATPTIDTEDLQGALTSWIIVLYSALMIISILVCLWVLRSSMRPLYILLDWLYNNDISKGVQPLVNPTKVNEFIQLNDAVMKSAQRSEELYNQQKQFTGNASHEIQTPIAVCRNRLDLLLETPLSEEQMGEIIKVQQTLTHISRLNKELLLLAKIDGGQFVDSVPVDITAITSKVADDYTMIYQHIGAELLIESDESLNVVMSSTLASVLITNLVKNAFVHNTEHGLIRISIKNGTLKVANVGVQMLDNQQVFSRFYQNKKREGSTGLGLAIVKSISDLYGFVIQYEFKDSQHIFSIKFR